MTPPISRLTARKLRLAAQTTAGVVVLGSVALAAMVPGGAPTPKTLSDDGPVLPIANGGQTVESSFRFDERAVADRLAMLDNAPRSKEPVDVVVVDPPKNPDEPVDDPKGLSERIKFLGTMRVGAKKMALISVDSRRQRVVAVGNALPMPSGESGVTLREAGESEIIVTDSDGVSLRISLETPDEKPSFSTLAVPASTTPINSAMGMSPDIANRFDRGGRGRSDPNSNAATYNDGPSASEAIERRRQALQQAVEKGTLTQERADEMMQRALDNAQQNARRNPGRRED